MSTMKAETNRSKVPGLAHWKCYHSNGKQYSYSHEVDGVKYSIDPIFSQQNNSFLGYSLTCFNYGPYLRGHSTIERGSWVAVYPFERHYPHYNTAPSAVVAARVAHTKANLSQEKAFDTFTTEVLK